MNWYKLWPFDKWNAYANFICYLGINENYFKYREHARMFAVCVIKIRTQNIHTHNSIHFFATVDYRRFYSCFRRKEKRLSLLDLLKKKPHLHSKWNIVNAILFAHSKMPQINHQNCSILLIDSDYNKSCFNANKSYRIAGLPFACRPISIYFNTELFICKIVQICKPIGNNLTWPPIWNQILIQIQFSAMFPHIVATVQQRYKTDIDRR